MSPAGTVATLAVALVAATTAHATGPRPAPSNLDGMWTNASYTQFERPADAKALVLTPEEARALEARLAKTEGINIPPEADELGQVTSEFNEAGTRLARIRGQIRSSWIVSPADGQVHYTDAGMRLLHRGRYHLTGSFDNPETAGYSTRCLQGNGSAPPHMSSMDTNMLQIVQTKDEVALAAEQDHDVRTIRLGAPTRGEPARWDGNSYGRWEGRTLVVETRGFSPPVVDRFWMTYSPNAHVTERFTRISEGELFYEFTVDDPGVLEQPVKGEMVFEKTAKRMFEYACHEGNYSLTTILQAARLGKQEPAAKGAPPNPATAPAPAY